MNLNDWYAEFSALPVVPLSQELASILAQCILTEGPDSVASRTAADEHFGADVGWRIFEKRRVAAKIPMTIEAQIFLLSLAENPMHVAAYFDLCQYIHSVDKQVTLSGITTRFPNGFPSKEALSQWWDKQKRRQG